MKPVFYYYLLLLGFLFAAPLQGQVNFFGKPGLMAIPTADWNEEEQLGISFAFQPAEYSLFANSAQQSDVNFYNVKVGFTSFMEINLSMAYRTSLADRIGVGDRQLDLRFRLLKEKKYIPAVVLGWTPPGSRLPILAHDYVVATKSIELPLGRIQLTTGYGSPFVFTRDSREDNTFWESLRIENRDEIYGNDYLFGFFGGLAYYPADFAGVMVEYSSDSINYGAHIRIMDWLQFQGYNFEGKAWAFHISSQFSLDFLPRALRRDAKDLD